MVLVARFVQDNGLKGLPSVVIALKWEGKGCKEVLWARGSVNT